MREEIQKYQQAAQLLQDCLELEYPPMAIKLAENEKEIPEKCGSSYAGSGSPLCGVSVYREGPGGWKDLRADPGGSLVLVSTYLLWFCGCTEGQSGL